MGHSMPSLDAARIGATLVSLLDAAAASSSTVEYRLVGTAAAVLQGVTLPAGDVDILVRERKDVDAFGAALSSFPCLEAPAWLAQARQYYGNWDVRGVELGISTVEVPSEGDTVETCGRGPWEHCTLVGCGRYEVPAVALELRLITELHRNRPDRYRPLVEFLRRRGCDLPFLERGFAAARLPPAMREEVVEALRRAPFRPVAGGAR